MKSIAAVSTTRAEAIRHAQRASASLPVRVFRTFGEAKMGYYAAALAFNAFVMMLPFIVGLLTALDLLTKGQATDQGRSAVLMAFPVQARTELGGALAAVQAHGLFFALAAIVGMLWCGTEFFSSMEFAFSRIYGCPLRPFLAQRIAGLRLVLLFGLVTLLTMGINAAIVYVPFGRAAQLSLAALLMIGLVARLYMVVPSTQLTLRQVLPGAILAGLAIDLLALAFPLLLHFSNGFSAYGSALALLLVLATWLYWLSQLLLLGAVFNLERARETGPLS